MSRISVTLEVESSEQEVLLRQYHAFLQEMEQFALSAPEGQVLDLCEAVALRKGQEVTLRTLEKAVQKRIEAVEKKGRRCEPVGAAGNGSTVVRPSCPS
jgi:hypothetical protein